MHAFPVDPLGDVLNEVKLITAGMKEKPQTAFWNCRPAENNVSIPLPQSGPIRYNEPKKQLNGTDTVFCGMK